MKNNKRRTKKKFLKGKWIVLLKKIKSCNKCKSYFENDELHQIHDCHKGDVKQELSNCNGNSNSKINNDQNNIMCEICNETFTNKKNLKRHKERTHQENKLKCTKCDYSSYMKENLSRHIKIKTFRNKDFERLSKM